VNKNAAITPCLFCHSDDVDISVTYMELENGDEFKGDMATCNNCHASAQLELWQRMVAFLTPIRECAVEILRK
jgi:hypothetical protein